MKLKTIIIGLVVILALVFLGLVGTLAVLFLSDVEISPVAEQSPPAFEVTELGTAGDHAYAIFDFRGAGNVTALSYEKKPTKKVVVINDSRSIDANSLPTLIDDLRELENYGYSLTITDETSIGEGIYIIPTGAIPSYALFNLELGTSNGTIIYIGEKDLLLSKGIKRQNWYDSLTDEKKERIIQYDGTLDDFIAADNVSLTEMILYQQWGLESNSTMDLTGDGIKTITLPMENATYMRLIYELDGELYGMADSSSLEFASQKLYPDPPSSFMWHASTLEFDLNKTVGTATMSIKKDGKVIEKEFLRRVTDDNVFIKKMKYDEPGDYIISVEDNEEEIASGILHIKDLQIDLVSRQGVSYVFDIYIDGAPVQDTEAYVGLGDSEKQKFYVSDGQLVVIAKLDQGENVFHIELLGSDIPYHYINDQKGFFDVYLTYGLPGLVIILVVYFGARFTRKPRYRLRFGDSATTIRQEIRVPLSRTVESFKKVRADMRLGSAPLTPHEFSMSLKRYLTNGADVTEGNVEEILKKLVTSGTLESHRDYYQLKGEGNVRRNTLRRMAREKLIESGTMFTDDGEKFVTKDFEIGFFGQKFSKKGIVIVDDSSEIKKILSGLSSRENSKIKILQANNMLKFVPIDKLSDVL